QGIEDDCAIPLLISAYPPGAQCGIPSRDAAAQPKKRLYRMRALSHTLTPFFSPTQHDRPEKHHHPTPPSRTPPHSSVGARHVRPPSRNPPQPTKPQNQKLAKTGFQQI